MQVGLFGGFCLLFLAFLFLLRLVVEKRAMELVFHGLNIVSRRGDERECVDKLFFDFKLTKLDECN